MPKVSIVIPLYNKGPYIGRALNSAFAQTEQDFEIIVVDDGSTDGGADIARRFVDKRVNLIRQPNAGVSVARNNGIKAASAELVAFLDADDAWEPIFLETVLGLHKKYPEAGMCCTAYQYQDEDGKKRVPGFLGIPKEMRAGIIPDYFFSMMGPSPALSSAVLIPQKTFLDSGFFPVGERVNEDLDLWFRIALNHSIAFSTIVGGTYFRDGIRSNSRPGMICKERVVKRSCFNALQQKLVQGISAEYVKEYINKIDLEIITMMILAGQKSEAKKMLAQCSTKRFKCKKRLLFFCLFFPQKVVAFLYQLKQRIYFKIPEDSKSKIL